MQIQYVYAESTVRPQSVEIGVGTVYLRKDIVLKTRTDEQNNKFQYWTYQEATLTTEEFNTNANAILLSDQKDGADSQLVVMEAIADLYDILAMMI